MRKYSKPKLTKYSQLRNITFSDEYHKERVIDTSGKALWWNVKTDSGNKK